MANAAVLALRVLVALSLAVWWVSLLPIHSEPFSGCEVRGFLTLQSGCSDWPQFLRGFGLVLIAGVIAPGKFKPQYLALITVLLVAPFAGFEGLRLGLHLDVDGISDLVGGFLDASPLVIGACFALVLDTGVRSIVNGRDSRDAA